MAQRGSFLRHSRAIQLSLNVLRLDRVSKISSLPWKRKRVGRRRQRQRMLHLQARAAGETWRMREMQHSS